MKPLAIPLKSVPRPWLTEAFGRPPRTLSFARAIAARYGRMGAVVRRLDLILAQRSRQDVSLVYRQGDRITNMLSWTSRFLLRAEASAASRNGMTAQPVTKGLMMPMARPGAVALSMPLATGKPTAIAELVERIASRGVRIETVDRVTATATRNPTKTASAMSIHELGEPEAHRIELPVVSPQRHSSATNSLQPVAVESLVPPVDPRQARGLEAKKAARPLAEHEVERIAERVIGSLDRRIVAQRERMGRT